MSEKLTKAQRHALDFLVYNGPVGAIPVHIGLRMVKKLVDLGLAEEAGKERGMFGFVRYQASDAGRAALEKTP